MAVPLSPLSDPVSLHPRQHLLLSLRFLSRSDKCAVLSLSGSNWYIPNGWCGWTPFWVLICHLHIFFREICSCLCPCPNLIICFFTLEFWNLKKKCILDTSPFFGYVVYEYFLPIHGLSFQPPNEVFPKAKALSVNDTQIIHFSFYRLCLQCQVQEFFV